MLCSTGGLDDKKAKANNRRECDEIEKKPNEATELPDVSFGNQKRKQQKLSEGIL